MQDFTPYSSTLGGALIGLSATILLATNGKIAGISGIFAGALPGRADAGWRRVFLVALVVTGAVYGTLSPAAFTESPAPLLAIALGGLLVGFGTRLGSGCTSGHGVCGLPRLSRRSLVAVVTFIGAGAVTVAVLRLVGGLS